MELRKRIEHELMSGNLVVLTGSPGCGKSKLISQTFLDTEVINKKQQALRGEGQNGEVANFDGRDEVIIKTCQKLAIDEARLFRKEQLLGVIKMIASRGCGMLLVLPENPVSDAIYKPFLKKGKHVVFFEMKSTDDFMESRMDAQGAIKSNRSSFRFLMKRVTNFLNRTCLQACKRKRKIPSCHH